MHDVDGYMDFRRRRRAARAVEVSFWMIGLGIFAVPVPDLRTQTPTWELQVTGITQACSTHCSEEATDVS